MVERKLLFLIPILLATSGCGQAPNDDPGSPSGPSVGNGGGAHEVHRSREPVVSSPQKYELQGLLVGSRSFQSREQCEGTRKPVAEAQTKGNNKRGEHGELLPNRPMLVCEPIL